MTSQRDELKRVACSMLSEVESQKAASMNGDNPSCEAVHGGEGGGEGGGQQRKPAFDVSDKVNSYLRQHARATPVKKKATTHASSVLHYEAGNLQQESAGVLSNASVSSSNIVATESWASSHVSPSESSNFELSIVGMGVDSSVDMIDATEAAVRALQDALSRSVLNIPKSPQGGTTTLQVSIMLGVPSSHIEGSSSEPLPVDISRLASVLPVNVTMKAVKIEIGGLWVSGKEAGDKSMCTVVASVTIQQVSDQNRPDRALSPFPSLLLQQPPHITEHRAQSPAAPRSSMELLAMISEEVRENRIKSRTSALQVSHRFGRKSKNEEESSPTLGETQSTEKGSFSFTEAHGSNDLQPSNPQVEYTDRAFEVPTASDGAIVLAGKSSGSAFPIKVHEVLSQLEQDGLNDIMSWQPHGRSFKVHKRQKFDAIVLPQYFLMTKKSSFLRQLNLYGFNRLSSGPDKGAYYHELFLRGMRFLCRRMTRSKVNGNGIRMAGTPKKEPNFYSMICVPIVQEEASEEENEQESSSLVADSTEAGQKQALSTHVSFPLKLQSMLDKLEAEGMTDVISWLPHGRGFLVHHPEAFVRDLMPMYFRGTKYSSFQRQLHMYSFQRITAGRDKGAYFHLKFLRGHPQLCQQMIRIRINGKGVRKPGKPEADPDFYQLPALPPAKPAVDRDESDLKPHSSSSEVADVGDCEIHNADETA